MAPTVTEVEYQTDLIIGFLLEDDEITTTFRCEGIETDGHGDDADEGESFNPALIADKLKRIADELDNSVQFQGALNELKKAVAQEALEAAFSHGVETLCQMYVSPEVSKEMQLIKAAVSFGLYVKNSAPEIKHKARRAMTAFLNMHVGTWVAQQGGWGEVTDA